MEDALYYLKEARHSLLTAKRWNMADLIGLPTAKLLKHRSLERSSQMVENARPALKKLNQSALEQDWGTFLTFADWFLDGPISNLCAGAQIDQALGEIEGAIRKLERLHA